MPDLTNTWSPNSQNDVFQVGQKSLDWRLATKVALSSHYPHQRPQTGESKQLSGLCSIFTTSANDTWCRRHFHSRTLIDPYQDNEWVSVSLIAVQWLGVTVNKVSYNVVESLAWYRAPPTQLIPSQVNLGLMALVHSGSGPSSLQPRAGDPPVKSIVLEEIISLMASSHLDPRLSPEIQFVLQA